jgi:methylmalonyl-CoA mutase cobalamin-binding subunit
MASQVMLEMLIKLRSQRLDPRAQSAWRAAPAAIVGSLEGNQHHIGTQCVRILLESLGWHVHYLGPSVPLEDFAYLQRSRDAELVCIALTPPATGGDLVRATGTLKRFYDHARPYALALGGSLPELVNEDLLTGPFTNVAAFDGCASFRDALQSGFAPTLEGAGS